jgi:hypothetical protein
MTKSVTYIGLDVQTEIDIDDQRCAGRLHRFRGLVEMGAVSRDKDQRGKIARQPDRGDPADALARTCNDSYRVRHANSPWETSDARSTI